MSKAITKSLSLPSDLIPLIQQAAAKQHKKFSEWIRDAALAKLESGSNISELSPELYDVHRENTPFGMKLHSAKRGKGRST